MKIKTSEIIYRKDLYPRFEPDQKTIQKYSESTEFLPPIKISGSNNGVASNILIDGYHRWKAYQVAGIDEIPCEFITVNSDKELKKLAYQYNSNHGIQLTNDEKRAYAIEMYGDCTNEELQKILSVSRPTIDNWTKNKREELDKQRNERIAMEYLKASKNTTQKAIADREKITQPNVTQIIENIKNAKISEFYKLWNLPADDSRHDSTKPYRYNIWNAPKQDNDRKHFGAFPEIFMENLLYYHTEPLDIVFDPFGGGGTTVDVCKRMFRRHYVSDRKVIPGREEDIKTHDIKDGLPDDLPKPKFTFLDPPYWSQSEKMYSESPDDLGNMTLDEFNNSMKNLLKLLSYWKVERIAIVIQPTQYKNNFVWTDHIFDFDKMLPSYGIEMRYILPYSTQQYLPQMVNKSKEENKCLGSHRDLVVWKLK